MVRHAVAVSNGVANKQKLTRKLHTEILEKTAIIFT